MDVVWKVVVLILNHRLTTSITYQDFIYGFQSGFGKVSATL